MFVLDTKYAGVGADAKLSRLEDYMNSNNISEIVLTVPEEVAWLLNLREEKIDHIMEDDALIYSPVFACEFKMSEDGRLLYTDQEIEEEIMDYLNSLGVKVIVVDKLDSPKEMTIVSEWKKIKNDVEIENMKKAHLIDGVVMTKFIKWLKEADKSELTEQDVVDHLEEMRQQVDSYLMPSFGTIAGYNSNGAVIHYEVTEESNTRLENQGVIVVDAGGQYLDGTTDTTRTISLGSVTDYMKKMYTAVLKGHIAVAVSEFPEGTTGNILDDFARKVLKSFGQDYAHGTGHGVGCLLNVHEHPRRVFNENTTIEEGLITSNEPGVYLEGEFGIRIENVIVCQKTENGKLGFENLTVCPYDYELIDYTMLNENEKAYLREYQKEIEDKLKPYLSEEEFDWLKGQPQKLNQ